MKHFQRVLGIALAVVIIIVGLYLLLPGFLKIGDVHLIDYALSEDGSEITLHLGVSGSAGYIRKAAVHQQYGGKLYLDCYRAFGGINSSIGAKNQFTIPLDADTETIALYRTHNAYEFVLERDEAGSWEMVR